MFDAIVFASSGHHSNQAHQKSDTERHIEQLMSKVTIPKLEHTLTSQRACKRASAAAVNTSDILNRQRPQQAKLKSIPTPRLAE